jgi:hypothetical protein
VAFWPPRPLASHPRRSWHKAETATELPCGRRPASAQRSTETHRAPHCAAGRVSPAPRQPAAPTTGSRKQAGRASRSGWRGTSTGEFSGLGPYIVNKDFLNHSTPAKAPGKFLKPSPNAGPLKSFLPKQNRFLPWGDGVRALRAPFVETGTGLYPVPLVTILLFGGSGYAQL